MTDEARDPSLEALLEAFRDITLDGVFTMLPGVIVSYDETKQMATVQPSIKRRHLGEDGVTIVSENLPQIHNCPVEFFGPARARITWPVFQGDTCKIQFSASSLARWIAQGGTSVDPGDDRTHDLADAIVCVGLHSPAAPPTDAPSDAIVLHVADPPPHVVGGGGGGGGPPSPPIPSDGIKIKLGASDADEQCILGTTYQGDEETRMDELDAFLALVATAVAKLATLTGHAADPDITALATGLVTYTDAVTVWHASVTAGNHLSKRVLLKK